MRDKPALADNWAHGRGPTGNRVSTTAQPPVEFSNETNVKWKVASGGRSSGSPIVWEDKVFVTRGHRGAYLGAFKLDGRGDIRGSQYVAGSMNQDTPDIASPLLSDGRIYFYKGKSGLLSCADAKTGKLYYSSSAD